jgi:glutamate synthase (NADPH/NADH) small chain
MAAFSFEYEHARQEGVQFLWKRVPLAIRTDAHRRLLLDTVQVQQVGVTLVQVPDSQSTISCNMVVPAIGQSPLSTLLTQFRHVEVRNGHLVADPATGRTGNPRYYAGGDCVNGGREVVDAVADGKRAALAMLAQGKAAHE